MELNLEGVVVGAASLLVIGAFHPLVIWCEYRFTQRAWPVFLIVGLLCLLAALLIQGFLSILLGLLAACLEEHFPHSMANAVVEEARRRGLNHEERHAKVEYLVAHGIASSVDGEQVRIGIAHFIFEDEKCVVPEGEQSKFDALSPEYSQLYLAIDGVLSAVLCISDPLREEAKDVLCPAGSGREKRRHAHRGQPPHRCCHCGAAESGRFPGQRAPSGQGGVCCCSAAGRAHRSHGRGRHQRLPSPLRGGRGHRHQRRGGRRPGDRRHHHRRRQPVGVGAPAAVVHGPDAPHPEQLPLCYRLQWGAHRPGRSGHPATGYLRHAPQLVHSGREPSQHERTTPAQNKIMSPDRARRECPALTRVSLKPSSAQENSLLKVVSSP